MADVVISGVTPMPFARVGAVLVDKDGKVLLSGKGKVLLQSRGTFGARTTPDDYLCDISMVAYTCFKRTPPENTPTSDSPYEFGESLMFGLIETSAGGHGSADGQWRGGVGVPGKTVMMRNTYASNQAVASVPVYDNRLDGAQGQVKPDHYYGAGFDDTLFPVPPGYGFHALLKWVEAPDGGSHWELVLYYGALYSVEFRMTDGTTETRSLPVEPGEDPFDGRYGEFPLCLWRQVYRAEPGLRGFHNGKVFVKTEDSFFRESVKFHVSSPDFTGFCDIQFFMNGTVPPGAQRSYRWVRLDVFGGDHGGVTYWYTSDLGGGGTPAGWEDIAIDAYGDPLEFPGWASGYVSFQNPKAPPPGLVGEYRSGGLYTPSFTYGRTRFPEEVTVTSAVDARLHPNADDEQAAP